MNARLQFFLDNFKKSEYWYSALNTLTSNGEVGENAADSARRTVDWYSANMSGNRTDTQQAVVVIAALFCFAPGEFKKYSSDFRQHLVDTLRFDVDQERAVTYILSQPDVRNLTAPQMAVLKSRMQSVLSKPFYRCWLDLCLARVIALRPDVNNVLVNSWMEFFTRD